MRLRGAKATSMAKLSACTIALILVAVVDRSTGSLNDYSIYDELIIPYEDAAVEPDTARYDTVADNADYSARRDQRDELRRFLAIIGGGRQRQTKRSRAAAVANAKSIRKDSNQLQKREFSYIWSPLTEQILPIKDLSKSSLSYNDLLALTEGYKAQQELAAGKSLASKSRHSDATSIDDELDLDDPAMCRTIRTPLEITKDDVDKSNNDRVLRTCKGTVQINRCEGACVSLVQPSVKSRSGFRKKCSCCNEATFRRVQVRLSDCYAAESGEKLLPPRSSSSAVVPTPIAADYMDVELDEPVDCKCRPCDG